MFERFGKRFFQGSYSEICGSDPLEIETDFFSPAGVVYSTSTESGVTVLRR
jgi:hypothetical protein